MENLTPSEVIQFRAECYRISDGKGVYSLYADRSDMRRLFTEESFEKHFMALAVQTKHAGLKIISETIKGTLAEVKYIEYFHEPDHMLTYYSKTSMIKSDSGWKIIRELREIKKHPLEVAAD